MDDNSTGSLSQRRWRLLPNRSISRRYSGDGPKIWKGSSRRPRRSHTMDNTSGDADYTASEHLSPSQTLSQSERREMRSPSFSTSRGPSLLQRFLSSTSRRISQTNLSEGSTVSRLTDDETDQPDANSPLPRTRRATMDVSMERTPSKLKLPISSTLGSPGFGVLRRFSGEGQRRATMDMGKLPGITRRRSKDSMKSDFGGETASMDEKDYAEMQSRLQRKAEDFHKCGQIEDAISQWVECLALAEENNDTLTNKTEIMCILVELHLQQSQLKQYEDNETLEDLERGSCYHRQAAKRYIYRIKPAMVQPRWWSPSMPLMDLLVEAEAWELSLLVANGLEPNGYHAPKPEQLATIHFQVASQKLDTNRHGEALQHLQATIQVLQVVPDNDRDMTLYTQVLQLLATEYNAQNQYELALDAYREQLKCSTSKKHSSLYCQMAHIYIVSRQWDKALEQLEAAASTLHLSGPAIRLQLLQTKGDVYCRLGRNQEALEVYQHALQEAINPAEKAKLLYTLGRLCVRLKQIRLAISYFTREMEITEAELGHHHLSVSRVLHELAKLYDEGLGESKMALLKLHKALRIELAVLQECHLAITKCGNCNQVMHRMCSTHAALQRHVSNQIRETKKAQGRLHFKLGDFEKALHTCLDGGERGGSSLPISYRAQSAIF